MALRYTCSLEGLEDNWVEVSEVWTRREQREYAEESHTFESVRVWWEKKFTAINIIPLSGKTIKSVNLITEEVLEDKLDSRVCDFMSGVISKLIVNQKSSAPFSGQLQLDGVETKTTPKAA